MLQLPVPLRGGDDVGFFDPAMRFFSSIGNAGITVAAAAAVVFYIGIKKARYFGNTAPLFCALILFSLVPTGVPGSPWLWALPFLLTLWAVFLPMRMRDRVEGWRWPRLERSWCCRRVLRADVAGSAVAVPSGDPDPRHTQRNHSRRCHPVILFERLVSDFSSQLLS